MKKASACIILALAICLSITSCNIKIDTDPDEWRIFHNQKQYSLSDYHIDYLKLSRYGTELAMIYDYDDMIALFDMVNELVLTKSHESNNLPPDFELLCTVSFVREYEDRANVSYYFNVSTTGEICYLRDRIAAVSVVYVGNSTEILDEVNRLIELYNEE